MNFSTANRSMTLLSRLFDVEKATQAYLAPTQGKPVLPANETPYFDRSAPEKQGVSSAHLVRFLERLYQNPALNMHTVLITRHNRVVCEAAFGAQDIRIPKYTFSACKSIVSLCVGMLVDDGILHLDDKLADLFADRISIVQKMRIGNVKIRDLLTMRTGIVFNELKCQTDTDWVKSCLNSSVNGEIGKTFSYNSLNTYMLAAIICEKTNMTLTEFAKKRLFDPLGITNFYWETCPMGIEKGGWGLYMCAEDLAKLGIFVKDRGMWNNKRLLSEQYLREATLPWVHTPDDMGCFDYGYQMWISENPKMYLFNGMLGQNVLIFPETDFVIVTNAGNEELFQQGPYYEIVAEMFGNPSYFSDAPMKEHEEDTVKLHQLLRKCGENNETEQPHITEEPIKKQSHPQKSERKSFLYAITTLFEKNEPNKASEKQSEPNPKKRLSALAEPFLAKTYVPINTEEQPAPANPEPLSPPPTPQNPEKQEETHKEASAASPVSMSVSEPQASQIPLPRVKQENPTETANRIESAAAPSVGLLPMILQAVHNAYSGGLGSVSLEKTLSNGEEQLLVTYREQKDTHVFTAGTEKSVRTVLTFCGIPFLTAARCRFTTDEDERITCVIQIDFLETPCTRIIKLFLNQDQSVTMEQTEKPGEALILHAVCNMKNSLAEQPVIGSAMEIIDNAYLAYRIRRMLAPHIVLREKTE